MRYWSLGLRAVLTVIFIAAGSAKLFGVEMMVETFVKIGWGQWFRYVTAFVEISSAILLWIPGGQLMAATLLAATMACAALFHVLVLGPSALPALVLGILCAALIYVHRAQRPDLLARISPGTRS